MSDRSAIEWTEATWNPVTGCTKVSPGCDHCYAETFAERFRGVKGHPYENGFDLTLRPERLDQPLAWRRPRMIFVNSMSDLFHARVPREFVAQVLGTMGSASWHTFQILTKRPRRMKLVLRDLQPEPLPNVWWGTSIELDKYVSRADELRQVPAAVRFLSLEPLLGPLPSLDLTGIDWVIVGGESGPHYRPINIAWVREIRSRCFDAGVPFFFKQWGGRTPKAGGRELDGRTWDQMPVKESAAGIPADSAPSSFAEAEARTRSFPRAPGAAASSA